MKPHKHIYIDHAKKNHTQRMFSYEKGNHHDVNLRYLAVCALDGGTITTKKNVCRANKKNKSLHNFYNSLIKMFEKQYDDYVLHFHIPLSMNPHSLHKENNASHVFHYYRLEEYDVQQRYLSARCETEVSRFSIEHAFRNHQLFTSQNAHNAMSIETFHVATDGSVLHNQRCGFGVAIGQDGTMYRSQMRTKSPNEAETKGIVLAIEKFARKGRHLVIYTDSEYILSKIYMSDSPKKFAGVTGGVSACIEAINNAIENGCKISFVKVKAHSGDVMNTSADKIARMSVKQVLKPKSKKQYNRAIRDEIVTMMNKLHGHGNYYKRQVMLNGDSAKVLTAA